MDLKDIKVGAFYLVKNLNVGKPFGDWDCFPRGIIHKRFWICKVKEKYSKEKYFERDEGVCLEFLGTVKEINGHNRSGKYKTNNHWNMYNKCVIMKVEEEDIDRLKKEIWIGDI